MEKVTYQPLLELIRQNADSLNQALKATMSATPAFRTDEIAGWVNRVIEPLFKAFFCQDAGKDYRLLDLLWRDMLATLSRRETLAHLPGAAASRLLLTLKPSIFAGNLSAMLKAMTSAYTRISRYSPQAAEKWLTIMPKAIDAAENSDEVMAAGRLAAWKCGMAHLHSRLKHARQPSESVLKAIFEETPAEPASLLQRWPGKNPAPVAAGAFSGLGGIFAAPPRVCLHENQIFASDGLSCAAVFADCHGSVLCDCSEAFIAALEFTASPTDSASAGARKILVQYDDLTSWVLHEQTLYLTIASSHSVFIFGAVDA